MKVTVDCEWPEYKEAVERLVQAALRASIEKFGLGVFEERPLRIKITIKSPPIPSKNLYYTVGREITIHWIRSSEKDPPPDEYMRTLVRSDGFMCGTMVFGLLHEIGHSVFPDMADSPPEVSEGLFEGWATFFAWSLIPLIWKELGMNAWPIPHNYFDYEMRRKKETIENPQMMEDYYIIAFLRIREKSGKKGIFNVITGLRQRKTSAIKQAHKIQWQINQGSLLLKIKEKKG